MFFLSIESKRLVACIDTLLKKSCTRNSCSLFFYTKCRKPSPNMVQSNLPRRFGKQMVTSPAMIAEDLFVDILLGANKNKAVGALPDKKRLKLKLRTKKLWLRSCQTNSRCQFQSVARDCVVVTPEGIPKGDTGHVQRQVLGYVSSAAGKSLSLNIYEISNPDG